MGRRYAIITSGHSGSTWLANALHRPEQGFAAFHEPLVHIVGPLLYSIRDVDKQPPPFSQQWLLEALAPYVDWARHREQQFNVAGEIHTGLGAWAPHVCQFLPTKRSLVVRNGIQVVHSISYSLLTTDPAEWNPGNRPYDEMVFPPGLESAPPKHRVFGYICVRWSEQVQLLEQLAPIKVYRLEDLTTADRVLAELFQESTGTTLTSRECAEIQSSVVNRKVFGDRSPENLFWNVWDDTQREIFQQVCASTLQRFGYSIPPKGSAPPTADLRPAQPRHEPETRLGPFAPLWVFSSNPLDFPILVYGADHRALLAAELLVKLGKRRVYLVHDLTRTWQSRPTGFEAMSMDQASSACPGGVFIADDAPTREQVEKLRRLFPEAEIVKMLSIELTAEQRQRRWDSGRSESAAPSAFGPFRVGEAITPDWRVEALQANQEGLHLALRSVKGEPLLLDLQPDLQGRRSPFPVAEGGLCYRSTDLEFPRIEPVCKLVARRVRDALAGHSLAGAIERWRDPDTGDR